MKNRNLFGKSMVLILVPLLVLSLIFVVLMKGVIEDYFRSDSYEILDEELAFFLEPEEEEPTEEVTDRIAMKWVQALRLNSPSKASQSTFVVGTKSGGIRFVGKSEYALDLDYQTLSENDQWPFRGEADFESERVFYAIVPLQETALTTRLRAATKIEGADFYRVAYIAESYSADLTQTVMGVIAIGLTVLMALVALVLLLVFRNISNRLKILESGAHKVGQGDFNPGIPVEPYDEIGRLGEAMNRMGQQLRMNQDDQSETFQMISHELKTPIMVMQGYLDALSREEYPLGSREKSIEVLEGQLDNMQRLTKDLLYINKAEYLARNSVNLKPLHLKEMFEKAFKILNVDHRVKVEITGEYEIQADENSFERIVENIVSNHLRYAQSIVTVRLGEDIRIFNDGPPVPEHLLTGLLKPFVKGDKGSSGLGLAIVANTLRLYKLKLDVFNREDGVEYVIRTAKAEKDSP